METFPIRDSCCCYCSFLIEYFIVNAADSCTFFFHIFFPFSFWSEMDQERGIYAPVLKIPFILIIFCYKATLILDMWLVSLKGHIYFSEIYALAYSLRLQNRNFIVAFVTISVRTFIKICNYVEMVATIADIKNEQKSRMDAIKIDWCATRRNIKMHYACIARNIRFCFSSFFFLVCIHIAWICACPCSQWLINVNRIEFIHRFCITFINIHEYK